ncbi:MAG: LL-diaminopimelate aminotransferase [Candidatus Sumerlaeaceae bacterium]
MSTSIQHDIQLSERLQKLPPYLFLELDRLKTAAIARGEDVINLGIGDPDQPTPQLIIDALNEAAQHVENHQYPLGAGLLDFRSEVASYYKRTRGVQLDPATEITALIGSKEGIGHFPLAFVNPGDVVLIPEPGYPVYRSATVFAGGEPYVMPLLAENAFLPDLDAIPAQVYERTKLMILNYPNNPTAAFATREFFERVIAKARQHGFIVLHDAAYLDMTYKDEQAISFLELEGAKEVGIEMHSLSKTFNMTGWRVAFAAGHPTLIKGLISLKSNLDSGVFTAIQRAAIVALQNYEKLITPTLEMYKRRLAALDDGMKELGWSDYRRPDGTFYVWLKTRGGRGSMEMTRELIEKCAIVTTPGNGFGQAGEGYFRLALTTNEERIREACTRIKASGFL